MLPRTLWLRPNSLFLRLIASAALWTLVALAGAGVILTSLYRGTVENAFDERLSVYLQTLVGTLAQQRPPASAEPGNLGEQRFEQLYSGWYWQVREPGTGTVLMASKSLFTDDISPGETATRTGAENVVRATVTGPEDQTLRILQRRVTFDGGVTGGGSGPFDILVAGNAGVLEEEIASFQWSVALTLTVFGVGLILATLAQVRFGLRPLDRVRRGLADLRSGKRHRIEGEFPAEIAPLTRELNALLQSNQEIIERARTQVGNLAHALKTPLSVVTNEARAAEGPLALKVAEQAELMRVQVNHYLNRARIAARSDVIGSATEVAPPLARLVRAMNRIYGDRVAVIAEIAPAARFRGEEQDLEEIGGNLLDNACKWGRSRVLLGVGYDPPADEETPGRLVLTVDDDGPGLTAEQCAEATRRGRRLDESKPGSGLGLSIVTDLVQMYGGSFTLGRSSEGGLAARVELPAA